MPQRRPVLLLTRSLGLGGTERQLAEMAQSLDRAQFEPHVGCFQADGFRAEELRASGVPVVRFPVSSFRSSSVLAGALALRRYLQAHAIQLVHTFDVPMTLFGAPAARFFHAPHVISSQRAHRSLTPGWRRRLLRVTDRMVDAIVVNSESVRRELTEIDHVAPGLIHLCYNGVDTARFRPATQPREGPLVIGVICALRPEKSLETLLRAFAQLAAPDVLLLIVGSGPASAGLETLAAELQLGARCRFEPATQAVAARLHEIDVFVLPSLSEAFSNSLLEAMACGCCVVASRVGGNPEAIVHQETGLLFQAGDSNDLAQCLHLLLCDSALRHRLAAAGTARIREHFTIARAAGRMAEIYRSVLES